ncbi:MAG: hypothetical protein L6Q95_01765 [Planctomycetes bacterium]|nr:hypothetical protein [Planctomycetota bacterium]
MRRAALLLLAAVSSAGPPQMLECKSPDGRHRLVIDHTRFELHEGERLVAKGELPQPPHDVHVLTGGAGAVLFEKDGNEGFGDTLAFLGADGKLRWKLSLEEAIPGGSGGAERRESERPARPPCLLWWSAWWVDEPRGTAVLVARNGTLADIDLRTGKSTMPAKDVILRAFDLEWARYDALRVAIELQPEGLREAAGKVLADRSLAPYTCLLAAVAVETAGGERVPREAWDAVLAGGDTDAARNAIAFAGSRIAEVDLVVRTALRKDVFAHYAVTALEERKAVGELAGLLTHGSIDRNVRDSVARALGRQAPEKALEAIDKEMEDANAEEGGALLNAAIATGAPDLERRLQHHEATLLKILDKETGDVAWLAGYFKGRPTSEAVKPLAKALARHKGDPGMRKKLIGALKPCSGEDFGDDADLWVKALAERR